MLAHCFCLIFQVESWRRPHLDAHRTWTLAIAFLLPLLAESARELSAFLHNLTGSGGWADRTHGSFLKGMRERQVLYEQVGWRQYH